MILLRGVIVVEMSHIRCASEFNDEVQGVFGTRMLWGAITIEIFPFLSGTISAISAFRHPFVWFSFIIVSAWALRTLFSLLLIRLYILWALPEGRASRGPRDLNFAQLWSLEFSVNMKSFSLFVEAKWCQLHPETSTPVPMVKYPSGYLQKALIDIFLISIWSVFGSLGWKLRLLLQVSSER